MSLKTISNADVFNKKWFHHRKASKDQLAADQRCNFSEHDEATADEETNKFTQKVKKKKDKGWIKARISLDMPVKDIILNLPQNSQTPKHPNKFKPPNSPSRKLTNFLSSLFTHSSKKKPSKSSVQSTDHEDQLDSKRRISISHFQSSNSPHVQTPTKSYKELLTFPRRHLKSAVGLPKHALDDKRHNDAVSSCKARSGVLGEKLEENLVRKFDDGEDSDSSSDLFELQIYDLDYYSTGLPVYESTDIDTIKRRNSISHDRCS